MRERKDKVGEKNLETVSERVSGTVLKQVQRSFASLRMIERECHSEAKGRRISRECEK